MARSQSPRRRSCRPICSSSRRVCDFRVAARKPATRFGLNEVPIGIHVPAAYDCRTIMEEKLLPAKIRARSEALQTLTAGVPWIRQSSNSELPRQSPAIAAFREHPRATGRSMCMPSHKAFDGPRRRKRSCRPSPGSGCAPDAGPAPSAHGSPRHRSGGQHGDRAVVPGPSPPARGVLARDKAPLQVPRVSVGHVARLAES